MLSKIGCLFLLFISRIHCFENLKTRNSLYKHKCRVSMVTNDYDFSKELQLIQKYKFYFTKENYNDVMEDLLNNKLSKIYLDNKYNQVVSVDNLPKDDILYNHYHLEINNDTYCEIYH